MKFFLISLMLFATTAKAQWSLLSVLTASTNRYEIDSTKDQSQLDLELIGAYKVQENFDVAAYLNANRNLKRGERKTLLNASYLMTSYLSYEREDYFDLYLDTRTYLPVKEETRHRDGYIGTVWFAPRSKLSFKKLIIYSINLTYRPAVAKNFHRFKTKTDGKSNNEYSFSQLLQSDFEFIKNLTLSLSFLYSMSLTYGGNRQDKFLMEQELAYTVAPNWGISIGHNNQGNALAPNGLDHNIEFHDEDSSTFYTALTYSI